jgi:hypothetical protein
MSTVMNVMHWLYFTVLAIDNYLHITVVLSGANGNDGSAYEAYRLDDIYFQPFGNYLGLITFFVAFALFMPQKIFRWSIVIWFLGTVLYQPICDFHYILAERLDQLADTLLFVSTYIKLTMNSSALILFAFGVKRHLN